MKTSVYLLKNSVESLTNKTYLAEDRLSGPEDKEEELDYSAT